MAGDWWLRDPSGPALDHPIRVRPGPQATIGVGAQATRPFGQSFALVTADDTAVGPPPIDDRFTLIVPPADWERVRALLVAGITLLLEPSHGDHRSVQVVGDTVVTMVGRSDNPWRHVDVHLVEVDLPVFDGGTPATTDWPFDVEGGAP
jgi:hypothetical protein